MARTLVLMVGAELPLLAVLGAAAVLVPDGRLSIGAAVGAVTYVTTALAPALRTLVHTGAGWLVQLGVISGRIAKTAEAPVGAVANEPRRPHGDGPRVQSGRVGGGRSLPLEASQLRFSYGPYADDVVKDLNLMIHDGEHLAIVGPSGGGKSTLVLLFARTLTPTGGQVVLDGRPLPEWDLGELRRAIAVIPQQAYLFAGSVWENLTYLCPSSASVSATEVDRAIAVFGLRETVQRLGGLSGTVPAGGHELSAGERQSVALARAWLSPASIVILDEATCHLDVAAETRAELAFRERGGTLIVIAHRFGSALRAQRILVLDGSSWVEGTHAELLTISARYRDLYGLAVSPMMATV
jgi:ATP-binding cassette subfamily C protein